MNARVRIATSPTLPAPPPPETIKVTSHRVACDGSGEVSAALGHPRIYLRIDPDAGFVECGYCDRRFVFTGGPADTAAV